MPYENLRLAKSALLERVYIGRINKEGNQFIGDKKDITEDFNRTIIDMYGGYSVVIGNGEHYYDVTVKEISKEEAEARLNEK